MHPVDEKPQLKKSTHADNKDQKQIKKKKAAQDKKLS